MPHFIPPDCQSLLRGMIEVEPEKRLSVSWGGAGGMVGHEDRIPRGLIKMAFQDLPVSLAGGGGEVGLCRGLSQGLPNLPLQAGKVPHRGKDACPRQ